MRAREFWKGTLLSEAGASETGPASTPGMASSDIQLTTL
jgi:hypothetical protein